jgi:hypothetical protein
MAYESLGLRVRHMCPASAGKADRLAARLRVCVWRTVDCTRFSGGSILSDPSAFGAGILFGGIPCSMYRQTESPHNLSVVRGRGRGRRLLLCGIVLCGILRELRDCAETVDLGSIVRDESLNLFAMTQQPFPLVRVQ